MDKVKRNRVKCLKCKEIIESKSQHDFVSCSCGACFVDGGADHCRWGCDALGDIEVMTEFE